VSVVNLTQVVFAMIFDVFCFGHTIDLEIFLGMALILVPTAWLMMEQAAAKPHGTQSHIREGTDGLRA
jgi:drug/metabolite transporter (DMT)-like permease